jgi:hypothetical protein
MQNANIKMQNDNEKFKINYKSFLLLRQKLAY